MSYITRAVTGPENIDANDKGELFGLAIPYNKVTTIGDMAHGGFREQIAPGACSKSLREADIVALWNHSCEHPLGRTSAGNLTLKNTVRGVEPTLRPTPTTYAQDLGLLVKGKVVRGWSFGFEVVKDTWTDDDGNPSNEWVGTNRTINEMKLIEVSPVTFPAYEMTDISARDSLLREREIRAGKTMSRNDNIRNNQFTDVAVLINAYNNLESGDVDSLPEELRNAFEMTVRGGNAPGDGSKPYGDVTYADPGYQKDGKKRYPIDTKAHAKAAWSYINQADNASQYTAEQLASIKSKIKAACKKFGIDVSEDNAQIEEWSRRYRNYNPLTGEFRTAGKRARCTRCGTRMLCPKCDIDPSEGNDTPEGGQPDADDDTHEPSDDTSDGRSVKIAVKRVRKALRGVPDPADLANLANTSPDKLNALKASTKATLKSIKAAKKLAKNSNADDDGSNPPLDDATVKRIPQISAALNQALAMFGNSDADLPDDVKTAIGLVSSAATHASHIMDHQPGVSKDSVISDNDKAGRSMRDKRTLTSLGNPSIDDGDNGLVDGDDQLDGDDDQGLVFCYNCNFANGANAQTCAHCGIDLPGHRSNKNPAKNKAVSKPAKSTSTKSMSDEDTRRAIFYQALRRGNELGL